MQDTHRSATIEQDGFHLKMYGDGSCSFRMVAPGGVRGFGVNERLDEERRRRPKSEPEWSSVGIGICKNASVLEYRKTTLNSDVFHWKIHSDLDRTHMPQPWAKGVMPIISSRRFRHWAQTQDRRVLEYQLPEGREDQTAALDSHLALLLGQWRFLYNHTTSVRNVLVGQGYEIKHTEIRDRIHQVRRESGFFREGIGGPFFGPNTFEKRDVEIQAFWDDVAAPFEALALVSSDALLPDKDPFLLPPKPEKKKPAGRYCSWDYETWR